jgi:DNA-binding SARP family transcriptional activator/predicted ATPase
VKSNLLKVCVVISIHDLRLFSVSKSVSIPIYQCYNLFMSHLAIFALGPLRVEMDGQPIHISRHKALALLVYLAVQPGMHTREALSAFLWPEYRQEKAYAYLRRTLWEIHNLLGEGMLEASREEIGFNPSASIFLDKVQFQDHLKTFNQHNHPVSAACPECIANLHKAALLYRGDFLAGFSLRDSANFDDWQFFLQEALRQEYADALQKLASLLEEAGSYPEAAEFAQRWLALDTLNEDAHRALMRTYALIGQRHAAVRQYQECMRILKTELGIDPAPTTAALYEAITSGKLLQEHELSLKGSINLAQKPAELGSLVSLLGEALATQERLPVHNLPSPATPFIGRQQELDLISLLLSKEDCWLLTLLGLGGIGKTRLAIEVGLRLADQFPQGVFFISLGAVEVERAITPAIARAMGLTFRPDGPAPEEQLFDFLREKRLLMILDSFEGLVQWASMLVQIHSRAAGIKLLVTSRHRLQLQGEWVLEVKGLEYPEKIEVARMEASQSYSAVELFLQAARRARVTFQAVEDDLSSISQITQLLEGMPLGLELAATWINTLSCQEIVQEISRGLYILETSLGDISERQHSMRAVFDHSWNLLSSREQVLLPRLVVFRGSFSRKAAEQIAGISLRELSGLVDKSLVRRTSHGRFDLHDLLRQYCIEKLEQSPPDDQETRRRHCIFYSTRMSEWNEQLGSEKQGQALREIETELENVRVAWGWAVGQRQSACLLQAVDGLFMFYLRKTRFIEGLDACQMATEALEGTEQQEELVKQTRLAARLLIWQAALSFNLELFEEAEQLLQKSRELLNDPVLDQQQVIHEWIFELTTQTLLAALQHDPELALRFYEQAFHLSLKSNGKAPSFWIFYRRFLMGGAVSKELYSQVEANLAAVRQSGDSFELGCHLYTLGIAELYHYYRIEKAEPLLRESIKNFQLVDDPSTQVMVFMTLGYLLSVQGRFIENLALKRRELEIYQDIGDRRMTGIAYAEVGEVLCHLGDYTKAEEQIRRGMALVQELSEVQYALRHRYLGDVLLAQGENEEAREAYQYSYQFFQSKHDKGWMLTALTGLSRAEFALGDEVGAWSHAIQALQLYREIQLYSFFVYLTLAEIALLLADRGELIRALELFGLVTRQGYLAQSRWFAELFGKPLEAMAVGIPEKEADEAKKQGRVKDLRETVETLLDEFG